MKLLVRNLSRQTTEAQLRELFEGYGSVQSCNIVLDAKTNLSKGFGFAEIPKVGEAKAAMKALNGSNVDGSVIRVKKASPKREREVNPPPAEEADSTTKKLTQSTPGETAN